MPVPKALETASLAAKRPAKQTASCPVHLPPLSLCTDNAAMIAIAGYSRFALGKRDALDIDILPTWPLDEL
jgi:N6-L-threonylcarbamoyladenine synthase